jgi:hypothetical protein
MPIDSLVCAACILAAYFHRDRSKTGARKTEVRNGGCDLGLSVEIRSLREWQSAQTRGNDRADWLIRAFLPIAVGVVKLARVLQRLKAIRSGRDGGPARG